MRAFIGLALLLLVPAASACTMVDEPALVWSTDGPLVLESTGGGWDRPGHLPPLRFVGGEATRGGNHRPPDVGSGMCPQMRSPSTGIPGPAVAQDLRVYERVEQSLTHVDPATGEEETITILVPSWNSTVEVYLQSPDGRFGYYPGSDAKASRSGFAFQSSDGTIRFGLWEDLAHPRSVAGPGRLVLLDDVLWIVQGSSRRQVQLADGAMQDLPPLRGLPDRWWAVPSSGGAVVIQGSEGTWLADADGWVGKLPGGRYHAIAAGWFVMLEERNWMRTNTAYISANGLVSIGPHIPAYTTIHADPQGSAYTLLDGEPQRIPYGPLAVSDWMALVPLGLVGAVVAWIRARGGRSRASAA